jgi:hypothetical protein
MASYGDLPHFPFDGREFRLEMGLVPLVIEDWIEFDDDAGSQLQQRAELLASERDQVLQYLDEAEEACRELNVVLRRHLLKYLPGQIAGSENQLRMRHSGMQLPEPRSGLEALEQLAHLAQEDFCILSGDERPRLIAGLVCFPSHWSLPEKLGQTSDQIHASVPDFPQRLSAPTNAVLRKLVPERPVWRLNWTIHDSETLHTPGPKSFPTELDVDSVLESTWLRIERQTLRRLPVTGAVVFTIRTYQRRMTDAVHCPGRREQLATVLTSLPAETAEYKGLRSVLPLLREALGRQ